MVFKCSYKRFVYFSVNLEIRPTWNRSWLFERTDYLGRLRRFDSTGNLCKLSNFTKVSYLLTFECFFLLLFSYARQMQLLGGQIRLNFGGDCRWRIKMSLFSIESSYSCINYITHKKRLFINLPVQYMKTTSSEHVVDLNCLEC